MSCTYDGAGNPTSFFNVGDLSTWTMTWKNGRELAAAGNGTHSVSYDYDVNSLRTYKIVDGVRHDYIYASGQLLRETYTQGGISYKLDFLYDQSGRPYMLYLTKTTSSGTTSAPYYYILNLQGDVLYLVNTSGVAVASYTYDPYGSILSSTGSLANVNPLRYRGYYYDGETGFYYLQSRYYDPALGRFLNADSYASTGQGFLGYNMFAYCGNNPVLYGDWSGTKICNSPWEEQTDSNTGNRDAVQEWLKSQGIDTMNASQKQKLPSKKPTVFGTGSSDGCNYTYQAAVYVGSEYSAYNYLTDVYMESYIGADITKYISGWSVTGFYVGNHFVEYKNKAGTFTVQYGNCIIVSYTVHLNSWNLYRRDPCNTTKAMCGEIEGLMNSVSTVGGLGFFACPGTLENILQPVIR